MHRQGLDQLIEKIENGTDIAPHLSRGILCGFKPKDPTKPKALLKRPDLDLLLNDWGIHHLHISTKLDKDGFVERRPSHPPRPLLFGIFRPDAAYLIDLMQHGDWTHTHLLEVAAREWPDAELVPELKGILPSSQPFSNEDRKPLRNAGISAPLERDGKVVAPIGFMSLAGTSIQTKSEVNRILGSLKRFLDQLTENPDYVADLLRQHGLPIPSKSRSSFHVF